MPSFLAFGWAWTSNSTPGEDIATELSGEPAETFLAPSLRSEIDRALR